MQCTATNFFSRLGPQDGNQIKSCDWWRKVRTDGLNVDEKLATLYILYNRNPQDTYASHNGNHDPTKDTNHTSF